MSTAALNLDQYRLLVAEAAPLVIKTEDQYERLLAEVERLMAVGEGTLSPEESALLELLIGLVHEYEEAAFPIPGVEPRESLSFLLEENGLRPHDVSNVLGSESRAQEILAGHRRITREEARQLGELFRVSPSLFL